MNPGPNSVAFNTRGDKRGGERSHRRLVDVVLHEERLLVGRLRARDVLALGGLAVGLGPREELLLRRVDVARLALPGLDAGRLERARVREGEARLRLARHLVDLVEVDGGVLLGDAAREEGHAGHGAGHAALERADRELRDLGRVALVGGVDAGHDHGGLEERALEHDAVLLDLLVDGGQDPLLDLDRGLDVVSAVDHDLGLHDRDQTGLLADASVARKAPGRFGHSDVRGHTLCVVDLERRSPLAEAGTLLVVRDSAVVQAIEACAVVFARRAAV